MKNTNKTVLVQLEFGSLELQSLEIIRFGNPFYPAKKTANQIKPGDLVYITGFYQHVLKVS